MTPEAAKAAFDAALEDLYVAFAPYRFNRDMSCCIPHCFEQFEIDALGAKPLRSLEPHDLYGFASALLLTCGEEADFKHFLPRCFELLTTPRVSFVDPEIMLGKLSRAQWLKWNALERGAVDAFLWAWWRLEVLEDRPTLEETFAALCCTGLEVTPYLRHWRDLDGVDHVISLAQFINRAGRLMLAGDRFNPFVGKEASRVLQAFMREPETRERFERAFLEATTMKGVHAEHLRALSLAEQLVQF
jgi:hypothetical protein